MRKVTFSADSRLLEQARQIAHSRRTNLSAVFREWIAEYVEQGRTQQFGVLMKEIAPRAIQWYFQPRRNE